MQVISKNINQCYKDIFKILYGGGKGIIESHPRGKTTYEFEYPVTTIYQNPSERFLYVPGRKLNLAFSLAEVIWILTGNGDVDWISFYNKNMRSFADEEKPFFNAAYGRRIRQWGYTEPETVIDKKAMRNPKSGIISEDNKEIYKHYFEPNAPVDQYACVYEKLKEDIDTRQACISLWDPRKDAMLVGCKDYPCNSFIQFRYKGGKLNLYIFRRSNDIVWGIPYNVVQFSYVLEMMAGWLGVEVGYVSEYITSLHVYFGNDENQDKTTKLILETDPIDIYTDSNDGTRKGIQTTDSRMSKEVFDKVFQVFYQLEDNLRKNYDENKKNFYNFCLSLNEHWSKVMKTILLHHAYKAKDDTFVFQLYSEVGEEYKIFIKDFYKRIREGENS